MKKLTDQHKHQLFGDFLTLLEDGRCLFAKVEDQDILFCKHFVTFWPKNMISSQLFFHFQLHRCRHLQLKYLRISNYFSGDPTRFDNEYLAWQTVGNENWISVFAYQSNDIRHELKQDIIKASYEVKNYTKTTMDEIKKLLVDIFPVDEFIEAQEKTKHKMIDVII